MKNVIPIVMAGVIGIYGLIIAVILGGNIPSPTVGTGENVYSIYTGMAHVSSFVQIANDACIASLISNDFRYVALRWTLLWTLWLGRRRMHRNHW